MVVQHPNFFGQLEEVDALVDAAHGKGALAIVSVDPISLGLLRRPGDYGADIVVAEGQWLGNPMAYGGPYLGILACREEFVRKMPGRVVGQTVDRHGKRCWVLTLQTREQHIRREKATSNICTNQGLLALRASIYLAAVGPDGAARGRRAARPQGPLRGRAAGRGPGLSLAFDGPFFKEFVIRCDEGPRAASWPRSAASATTAGSRSAAGIPELADVHPRRRDREADRRPRSTAWPRPTPGRSRRPEPICNPTGVPDRAGRSRPATHPRLKRLMYKLDPPTLLFETSRPGRATAILPGRRRARPAARRARSPPSTWPTSPPPLPELGELDVVRHFTNLSTLNMSIDTNFYPLGSCTMKYNPKRNERLAALPGFAALHPYQDESTLQGMLAHAVRAAGDPRRDRRPARRSLQPAAGAQGELTALLVAAAYFRDQGETADEGPDPRQRPRHQPRPAHLAGFEAVTVKSDARGLVDLDDFQAKLDDQTAVFMITNPNTLGLFDPQIGEIADLLHDAGPCSTSTAPT